MSADSALQAMSRGSSKSTMTWVYVPLAPPPANPQFLVGPACTLLAHDKALQEIAAKQCDTPLGAAISNEGCPKLVALTSGEDWLDWREDPEAIAGIQKPQGYSIVLLSTS